MLPRKPQISTGPRREQYGLLKGHAARLCACNSRCLGHLMTFPAPDFSLDCQEKSCLFLVKVLMGGRIYHEK